MLSEAKTSLIPFETNTRPRLLGYNLTNKHRTTLYIGITNNIQRRLYQHGSGEVEGFTKRYNLNRLVWVEHFRNVNDAIAWRRSSTGWQQIALIEQTNPRWLDLSDDWEQQPNVYDRPHSVEEMI